MQISNNHFNLHLNDFDGPLEVLLQLIKNAKMDIYDINIAEITDQYLELINTQSPDLNIVGDYFVMAATLMKIKSKTLLPAIEYEDEEPEDPREVLVNQLINYQSFKLASEQLKKLKIAKISFTTEPVTPVEVLEPLINQKDYQVSDLLNNYLKVTTRIKVKLPMKETVNKWKFSVEEQSKYIINKFKTVNSFTFDELIEENKVSEAVVTNFLAILELSKHKEVFLKQKDANDSLVISDKELNN